MDTHKKRLLLVGLEPPEIDAIKSKLGMDWLLVASDMLPNIRLVEGVLYVESPWHPDKYLPVDKVIFHGIFEHDYDFITLLALWNGDCLPNALGMMDCRLRHAGLVRALRVSKFGNVPRGMSIKSETWETDKEIVGKWGNWHCGENKHKFTGQWDTQETTTFEPFFKGEAVRIMLVGDEAWQIKLTGDDWLKSIHHHQAGSMPIDNELLEDTKCLAQHFGLQIIGVDYMVNDKGEKLFLEVNHIPNVTVFPFVNEIFIQYAIDWVNGLK